MVCFFFITLQSVSLILKPILMAKVALSNILKESLKNLRLFYDHSPDMYISLSPENAEVLYCNKTLLSRLNYTKEEVIGNSFFNLCHPNSIKKAKQAFDEFILTGIISNKEMALISNDAEKIDVSLNANAIRDKKGKILFSISSLRDISDIVQTKSVLNIKIKELDCIRRLNTLQSFRQLSDQDFLRQSLIAIKESWLSNEESGVIINYFDQTFELLSKDNAAHLLTEEIIIKNMVLGEITFCLSKEDYQYIEHHKNVIRDIRNILVDTLTSKQTDELMMILESAIKSSNDCIAIASPEGEHIYQNEALQKMLGYSFEEMKKKKPSSMYSNTELGKELFRTIMNGDSWKGEAELIHKKGHSVPVLIRADAIKNQKNEIIGLVGIHTDISDKIELEKNEKNRQKQALKIFDSIDEIVYVSDPVTYELLFTNKNLNKTIGQGKNLEGKLCYQALQGKDKPCEFCNNIQLFNKNHDDAIIWEFQNLKNNQWYRLTDKKIPWFDGREVRMEIGSNITEVKEINIKLAESEERYKLATTASDNGIWDWWVNENKVFYSDKWKAQLGYLPEELEDKFESWQNNLHPDDLDRMNNAVQEFLQNPEEYFIHEFRLKHKNGSYRWIRNQASAVLNTEGKVIRMFGSHSDITEKKEAEAALHKMDQMYRNLIQNAPDGIALIDYDGNYKFISPSGLKLFGYSEDEILNKNSKVLTHSDDIELKANAIDFIINDKTNSVPCIEYRLLTKSNKYIWIESNFSKTTDQNGDPAIVINFRDISERKEYEKKLIMAKKKAEIANIHKNQFLANMSHEIRTPMNGVIGFADLLKNDDLDKQSKHKFIQVIDNNAKQLLTLIDDIIDISKIEADELKIAKSTFNVNGLLEDLKNLFNRIKSTKISKNIELKLNIPDSIQSFEIFTDQARLRQILSNLLGNALKFTDNGVISFGYSVEDGFLHFFVEDNGRGIPHDKIDSIFERFQQSTFEDATLHGGTGLGLAICKGLVEVLGGQISVRSQFGFGSRFEFSIPTEVHKSTKSINDHLDLNNVQKCLENKTILLAEDDPSIQFYYETVFELYNSNLIVANNGQEAVDIFKKNPNIDIVLMDIRMPDLNGYEATREILNINSNTPIIAQTAYIMADEKEKCLKAGCIDYLTKPIKKEELVNTILKYI